MSLFYGALQIGLLEDYVKYLAHVVLNIVPVTTSSVNDSLVNRNHHCHHHHHSLHKI